MAAMDKTVALTEQRVQGLGTTIELQGKSYEKGIQLILEKQSAAERRSEDLQKTSKVDQDGWEERVVDLEKIKERAEGGMWVFRLLALGGITGGVISVVKLLKGL